MKVALLIGINYYDIPDIKLNGCIDDIAKMKSMLIDAYGYERQNIIELRDDTTDDKFKPTRANILNNLKLIASRSKNLEEIWIHYSGHGTQVQFSKSSTTLDEVIVPMDYQTKGIISCFDLISQIQLIKCKTILLFDCCHSGTVSHLPWIFEYKTANELTKTRNNNLIISNPNIFAISGCKDDQTSLDTYNYSEQDYMGAFTNAFIECLRDNKHNVSILKLYGDICNYLTNTGYKQRPILSSSTDIPSCNIVRAIPKITPTIPSVRKSGTIIRSNMNSIIFA